MERRQHIFLAQQIARAAEDVRTEDVEQPDEREHLRADLDPQPLVVEIGGEMRRDEGDVEAADEEARVEQPVAALRPSLPQRVPRALLTLQAQARAAVGAPPDGQSAAWRK